MATTIQIRKNSVTGEWEHYVESPVEGASRWVPGISTSQRATMLIEEQPLTRNAEDFLISFEDINYDNYEIPISRLLPTYTDVKNIYDKNFTELYTPTKELTVSLELTNPTLNTVDIKATVVGGYPYISPNKHYNIRWSATGVDSSTNRIFGNIKVKEILGAGVGEYFLTVIDSNGAFLTTSIKVTPNDFVKADPDIVVPPEVYGVELRFLITSNRYSVEEGDDEPPSDQFPDENGDIPTEPGVIDERRGELHALLTKGESVSPYEVYWTKNGIELTGAVYNQLTLENVGIGTYRIQITDANDEIVIASMVIDSNTFRGDGGQTGGGGRGDELRDETSDELLGEIEEEL